MLAGFSPDTPLPIAQELGKQSIAFLVHPTYRRTYGRTVNIVCFNFETSLDWHESLLKFIWYSSLVLLMHY